MFDLIIFLVTLVGAYLWGSYSERRHYASLVKREAEMPPIPVVSYDYELPAELLEAKHATAPFEVRMVSGNVVIGADYFKTVLAGLINVFGGNISTFESVLERGRREAILRARKDADGADYITNFRYETTFLSEDRSSAPRVEIFAYGTAIYLRTPAATGAASSHAI